MAFHIFMFTTSVMKIKLSYHHDYFDINYDLAIQLINVQNVPIAIDDHTTAYVSKETT